MNRLADETSPYLRQHADNPVDWYPWGDEAFAAARERDVPLLLSVGYSSCHWCHVMAHESFEDDEIARVMNELFVCVKVDREERPDVDAVYMQAVQAMTGRGGWPMTVFLIPDGRPFFGGTYYPPSGQRGMPGFVDVMRAVEDAWRNRREDLDGQADKLAEAIGEASRLPAAGDVPGREVLDAAYGVLRQNHDDEWGGFGQAPKFPQPHNLELVVRALTRNNSPVTRAMLETSLDAMASGGIYDHLGGGFARYSVDRFWLVPHFEKMLYDNALLARLYLHAAQVTAHARYWQVLDETIGYVLRDLRHPEGGFFSAEDADSEGVEGKFYTWTAEELVEALGADVEVARDWYEFGPETEFSEAGRTATILSRLRHRGDLLRPPEVEDVRRRLFEAREERVRPGLDDKVLTEWNGLMLATLAEAAFTTGRREWLDAARTNGEFLLASLRRDDGRWLRSWQADGGARHLGVANDYAAVVDAFVRLGEATGEARWVRTATETADAMIELFWDDEAGGLFTTGHDAETLISRDKDVMDTATPSANSVAAGALARLAALTGEQLFAERSEAILALLGQHAGRAPTSFGYLLGVLDQYVTGTTEIVVTGDRPDLVDALRPLYRPCAVLAWGERYDSPLWSDRADGAAHVCRNYSCNLPAEEPRTLLDQLAST